MATPKPKPKRDLLAQNNPEYAELLAKQDDAEKTRVAYLVREFVQCSFPYSNPGNVPHWERKNGDLTFRVTRLDPNFPHPYGSFPRLVMFWVCTKLIEGKDKSGDAKRIMLDGSLSAALRDFGYTPNTAAKGKSRANYKQQVLALCKTTLSFSYDVKARNTGFNVLFASRYDLWWDEEKPQQDALFPSFIEVTEEFYQAVMRSPVPIPNTVIRNHVKSPLELDLLVMLNHRLYSVNRVQDENSRAFIPFQSLYVQFGQEYGRADNFRAKVRRALVNIKARSWPELKYEFTFEGLTVHKSPPLIKPKKADLATRKGLYSERGLAETIKNAREFDAKTLMAAKSAAPGWDIYSLQASFWEWVQEEGIEVEKDPRPMFVSFCRTHARKNRA